MSIKCAQCGATEGVEATPSGDYENCFISDPSAAANAVKVRFPLHIPLCNKCKAEGLREIADWHYKATSKGKSDIVDGKAVRDLKKGETITVDVDELRKLLKKPEEKEEEDRNVIVATHHYRSSFGCKIKIRTIIAAQHAHSLSELVKWFKKMIEQGHISDTLNRSDKLTAGYCDELLEDLGNE